MNTNQPILNQQVKVTMPLIQRALIVGFVTFGLLRVSSAWADTSGTLTITADTVLTEDHNGTVIIARNGVKGTGICADASRRP